ncbi:MAG: hypothetical protein KME26_17980 [Oscillatoria princeps RMCB-10]|jgi:hypothetical protein|nr:hypothetical protein [Oscillatoria princeps RMCB-10]
MCEWRQSESNPPPALKPETSGLSAALPQRAGSVGSRLGAALSLAAVLGLGTGVWLLESCLAPQIARADTARADVSVESEAGESYDTLLRRAETVARAAVQRSFDRDISVSEVSIVVLGENKGAIAPILSLQVSRNQWGSRPAAERWAKYYPTSKTLLGFGTPQPAPGQPGTAPAGQTGTAPARQPGTAPAGQTGKAPARQPGKAPARQPGTAPTGQPTAVPTGPAAPAGQPAAAPAGPSAPATGPSAPATGPSAPATGPSAPATGPSAPPAGVRSLRSGVSIPLPGFRWQKIFFSCRLLKSLSH